MVLKNTIFTVSSENGFGAKLSKICSEFIDGNTQTIIDLNSISKDADQMSDLIINSNRLIFVMPEFNGSFPASFKEAIDNLGWPNKLLEKPIFLIGYSGGFSGNLSGVNHMKTILNYIKADVSRDHACFTYNGKTENIFEKEKNILIENILKWNEKTREL
tara:strand:- start:288 stop:767 length:480 start_codon:yes stop_codon:yes gene_type:complete